MKTAYILLEDGFEETEAIGICDILRRGNVNCLLVGMKDKVVTSSHNVKIEADKVFDGELADMVILPGGVPGANRLKENQQALDYLNAMNDAGKFVCAICAAPTVLAKANLVTKDLHITCYPGFEKELGECHYEVKEVVQDGNIITSRGPATTFVFGYYLYEQLGYDSTELKAAMLYNGHL